MGWYITIQQEMRDELGLKGNELLVFAFINGYSQEGQGCFYGSLSQLSRMCGIKSKTTTQKILKSLIAKGAILKGTETVNGVKFCTYKVSTNWHGISEIDMGGISEIGTNNKDNIYINSLSIKGRGRFQKPSVEDIRQYCISRGNKVDPEQFFDFYESNGWMVGKTHMKDWRAAVRTWEKREKEIAPRKRESRKESILEHNLKVVDQLYGTRLHETAYGGQADEQ